MILPIFYMLSHNYSFYFLNSYSQEDENANSPPTSSNSSATTTIGQPIDIQLEVSDAENNELQLTIVDQPQLGTLGEMNTTTNTVTYTPNPDAIAGSDSFTYTVNDGTVDSQPATVTIAVVNTVGTDADTAVNDTQPTGSEDIEQSSQVDGDTVGTDADTAVNDTQPTGSEDIEQSSQVDGDTVGTDGDTVGTDADTAVNDTQPTGSEDIEQSSQVDGDTVGTDADTVGTDADTGNGTDTGLGLESLLGPDETPQTDNEISTDNSPPVASNSSATT